MKKTLRAMTLMSVVASSLLFSSPANAAPNDLTTITAADAVAFLTDGNPGITVIPGSEVVYGSMKSFTSINLSPGFELPDSGILLNSHTGGGFGADNSNSAGPSAIRAKLDAILAANGVSALTTNVSALSFSFTADPSVASILVDFIFASAEIYTSSWDVAALIVDNTNYAYLSNGNILRVRPESNLCNFYIPVNQQNPAPICANVVPDNPLVNYQFIANGSPFNSMNEIAGSAAPTARIAGLLNQNLTTHTVTFAVADTDDEIVPSFFMFSPVRASTQAFAGISAQLTSAPDAPASVVATATGKTTASVSFEAPAYDGDSTITSYTATSSPGGITKTLTQAGGGTFEFTGLQPNTAYTFSVTATNAIGTSAATTSNSIKTKALLVASISSITFADDGTGTGGRIVWAGKDIDAVLYSGPEANYPGAFNYGAFTGGWDGRLKDLLPDTTYTASVFAVSEDGVGVSKTFTFKTGAKKDVVKNLSYWATWVNENTYFEGEARIMLNLLSKFDSLTTSEHRTFIKVPVSRVATVLAKSLTPDSCMVEADGVVNATSGDTCTISYTVTGGSKAPATLVKDFKFVNFKKK